VKRLILGLVIASVLLVGVGYAAAFSLRGAPVWAPWCLAIGTTGCLMSLTALGAVRCGTLAPVLRWTFGGVFVLCASAFGAALLLPPEQGAAGPLLLGLPLRAAIVILGVGIAPILVLPMVYALTFNTFTLSDEDLRRVRDACAAVRRTGDVPP
jgi:uncharacterized membrane protein